MRATASNLRRVFQRVEAGFEVHAMLEDFCGGLEAEEYAARVAEMENHSRRVKEIRRKSYTTDE